MAEELNFDFKKECHSDRILQILRTGGDTEDENMRVQARSLQVNSNLLADKSPFFKALFTNGMKESSDNRITLSIEDSKVEDFFDLLQYMYSNELPRTTPGALLDVMVVADQFAVPSCMTYCILKLLSSPMTLEVALGYLTLPQFVFWAFLSTYHQEFAVAATQFLSEEFKDLTKYRSEVMKMPLIVVEAILSRDDLRVPSEDDVYEFVVKWAEKHYTEMEERRTILSKYLLPLIRFPFVSCQRMKDILVRNDIVLEEVNEYLVKALLLKAETLYGQLSADEVNKTSLRHLERPYRALPVKVLVFKSPQQQCLVYWDLKREHCAGLVKNAENTCSFYLGGVGFHLSASCIKLEDETPSCFKLLLVMDWPDAELGRLRVHCELAARMQQRAMEFQSLFIGEVEWDRHFDLFTSSWSEVMKDDSNYFIDGVAHLRLELKISDK